MTSELTTAHVQDRVAEIYTAESRRVFATLIRLLGDFDRAEEALHDAFIAAVEQWPRDGIPANPRAWLVSAGRFKAIDAHAPTCPLRRLAGDRSRSELDATDPEMAGSDESVEDDRLRLIFTCCHPAIAADARVALTLREVCGLTTEAIARAFLTAAPTMAQRIVRAKAKIRDARIPYQVPTPEELPDRIEPVLRVIYLVFNEGYSASAGDSLTRPDLSGEAIRLGRLLVELLPEPEVIGLLALMLLQESRRTARTAPNGDLILLEDSGPHAVERGADRGRADAGGAVSRHAPLRRLLPCKRRLAAVHARAQTPAATDWGADRRPLRCCWRRWSRRRWSS